MAEAVLDSSAILAIIFEEPGWETAYDYARDAAVSANIIAEVSTKLWQRKMPIETANASITRFDFEVYPVTFSDALAIGALQPLIKSAGLSLGDRSCLALAAKLGLPAVTADKAWATIAEAVGVEVRLIR